MKESVARRPVSQYYSREENLSDKLRSKTEFLLTKKVKASLKSRNPSTRQRRKLESSEGNPRCRRPLRLRGRLQNKKITERLAWRSVYQTLTIARSFLFLARRCVFPRSLGKTLALKRARPIATSLASQITPADLPGFSDPKPTTLKKLPC